MKTNSSILAKELKFLEDNRSQLVLEYGNKILLIHGDNVIDAFESEHEATTRGVQLFNQGPFLVRAPHQEDITLNVPVLSLGIPVTKK